LPNGLFSSVVGRFDVINVDESPECGEVPDEVLAGTRSLEIGASFAGVFSLLGTTLSIGRFGHGRGRGRHGSIGLLAGACRLGILALSAGLEAAHHPFSYRNNLEVEVRPGDLPLLKLVPGFEHPPLFSKSLGTNPGRITTTVDHLLEIPLQMSVAYLPQPDGVPPVSSVSVGAQHAIE